MSGFRAKGKICIVVSSEMTVKAFLLDQISALSDKYDVTVVLNTKDKHFLDKLGIKATVLFAGIARNVSLWKDIKALVYLGYLFRKNRFDIVHSVTPKAGLLSMISGFLTRIPIRIHTFTGQVWVTKSGLKKWLLKLMDKLLALLATNVLIDSNSQRAFLVEQGVVSEKKSIVLAKGSVSGVDTKRFSSNHNAWKEIRNDLNISEQDMVILFLGRLNKDKGVLDLSKTFCKLCEMYNNTHLLLVGPDEEKLKSKITEILIQYKNRIHFIDYTNEPEKYMAAADIFCLPSYREGFGTVVIEAACSGIPAIGSRIYGITDAIEENVTGLLFNVGDIDSLLEKMLVFINNPGLRKRMGENAHKRAIRDFPKEMVTAALLKYYEMLLSKLS